MFGKFKADKNYLGNFHFLSASVFFILNASLGWFTTPDLKVLVLYAPAILLLNSTQIKTIIVGCVYALALTVVLNGFDYTYVGWLIGAVLATLSATALLHNASHKSFKPKWLNRPMGELMCLFQLTGFPDWTVIHIFHHAHSDDPTWDPHPPGKLTYWQYVTNVRKNILSVYVKHYFKIFGSGPDSMKALKRFGLSLKVDHFMKVLFWYLALGPKVFSFFYFPSIVFKMLNHAWVNWATHRWNGTQNELTNFTEGIYKLGNFFGFGIYYHKNHHLNPSLFDPRDLHSSSKDMAA